MDRDPTPALTGRRRIRPTSIGSRKPWQPKPGRAPLIAAQAAVQTNRATSIARIPSRTAPREVLLWPPSAPLPNPATTLPPAFLQFSRERGDEARAIGAAAAARQRG